MKLTVQHYHIASNDELDSHIEERILSLQPRLQIDEALVRLECRFEESPQFNVRIHLVTPGPDVMAECRDHTLLAAVEKVLAQLDEQITHRIEKRRQRVRSNAQAPALLRAGCARH